MANVWIIGASSGIGAALALALAAENHAVVISARRADLLHEVSGRSPRPGAIVPLPLDVRDHSTVEAAAAQVFARFGRLDYCFLNAGKYELSRSGIDPLVYAEVTRVNYLGVVEGLSVVIPRLIQQGSGQVLVTASVAGYRGLPQAGAYGPTKAALISLCETLAVELKSRGVTVRVINPGFVRTPITAKNRFYMPFLIDADDAAQKILRALPSRRFEIAFPWQMVMLMKIMKLLPNWLYLWIMTKIAPVPGTFGKPGSV
ncbi:short-chain dehydrogenase/reductase SDR [mine drainage metagenome]|uniref:Short-chain dehydrogenase/reductase SDR n=1 Tax=mine drainage metagenome TaxID=410659 RepID=T1BJ60_9ZZZZ